MRRAGLLAVTLVAGCIGTTGLTGGTTDGGNAPDGSGTGGADAAVEASAPVDAGSEAGAAVDAPIDAATACTGLFSDDFNTSPLGAAWTSKTETGASLSLDTSSFTSPPSALLVAFDMGAQGKAYLTKRFQATKSICCELSLQIVGGASIAGPMLAGMGDNYDLEIDVGSGTYFVHEIYQPAMINRIVNQLPALDAWHRVRLAVAFPNGPGTGTLSVAVDDKVFTDTIGDSASDLTIDHLDLGVTYSDMNSALMAMRVDDLACGTGP